MTSSEKKPFQNTETLMLAELQTFILRTLLSALFSPCLTQYCIWEFTDGKTHTHTSDLLHADHSPVSGSMPDIEASYSWRLLWLLLSGDTYAQNINIHGLLLFMDDLERGIDRLRVLDSSCQPGLVVAFTQCSLQTPSGDAFKSILD